MEGGLTFLAVLKVEALVPRDPASVSSADACSLGPGRSMIVVAGSSAPSCEKEESKPTVPAS